MTMTFLCKNCGKEKPVNTRLKGDQEYCGDDDCQRARKREWQKNKMRTDTQYKDRQTQCLKKWRKKRSLDKYQHDYREKHPEYVLRNRELQWERNKKRDKRKKFVKIVKMDALEKQSEKLNTYVMNSYKIDSDEKIVKMDTLFVQLVDIQNDIDIISCLKP